VSLPPILPRPGWRFPAAAAGVLLALLAAWPAVHGPWARGFHAAARALAARCGAAARVRVGPAPRPGTFGGDTVVRLLDPAGVEEASFVVPSFRTTYAPFAVVAALALADRLVRRRRGPRGVVALAGVAAWLALGWILVVQRTALRIGSSLFHPGPALAAAVEVAYRVVVNPPGFEYAVPAMIWLACGAAWPGEAGPPGVRRRGAGAAPAPRARRP
jgi:hypothetical protein